MAGQLLVARKLSGAVNDVSCRGPPLIFVTVIVCAGLALFSCCAPKLSVCGLRLAIGGVPGPVTVIVAGPPLVSTSTLPVIWAAIVGVNTTLKVQLAPGERMPMHVAGVTWKSGVPKAALISKSAVPSFAS